MSGLTKRHHAAYILHNYATADVPTCTSDPLYTWAARCYAALCRGSSKRKMSHHPTGVTFAALLPELAALGDVLARQPHWADDLRAVRARQLRILQVSMQRRSPWGPPDIYVLQKQKAMHPPESLLT